MYVISAGPPDCDIICIILVILAGILAGTSVCLVIVLIIKKVSFFCDCKQKVLQNTISLYYTMLPIVIAVRSSYHVLMQFILIRFIKPEASPVTVVLWVISVCLQRRLHSGEKACKHLAHM